MAEGQPVRREVVGEVGRTARTARAVPDGVPPEMDSQITDLISCQLSAGLRAATALLVSVGSLPLLLGGAGRVRIAGVGLSWIVLGVLVYPVLLLIGRWYLARVERNEEHFGSGPVRP